MEQPVEAGIQARTTFPELPVSSDKKDKPQSEQLVDIELSKPEAEPVGTLIWTDPVVIAAIISAFGAIISAFITSSTTKGNR